jgi:predicted phosphodiesterase
MGRTYGLWTDPHYTRRPPASCTDSYLPDLLDLTDQALAVFRERAVAAAICGGDMFHHKAPSRTDHELVGELGERFLAQPYPVWAVPGNHDMQHDKMASVGRTQPLGVLFRTRAAHCLDGWMGGEHPVFGVPWQQHWSELGISEALRPWREQRKLPSLIVTHAPIYPRGSEPRHENAELTPADWWVNAVAEETGGPGVFYGHIHENHGVWRRGGIQFCNHGAMARGSLGEDNLTRDIGVTLWREDTGEFEFVRLDARPAEQVFRLRERERVTGVKGRLDDFLTEIGTVRLPRVSEESALAAIRARTPDREVISLAEEIMATVAPQQASR